METFVEVEEEEEEEEEGEEENGELVRQEHMPGERWRSIQVPHSGALIIEHILRIEEYF